MALPKSAKLWTARGKLVQLRYIEALISKENQPDKIMLERMRTEIFDCFMKAICLDSARAEPFEELGFMYYSLIDDLDAAEIAFRRALKLSGFSRAHIGLAQVLLDQDRRSEALRVLRKHCKTRHDKRILRAVEEGETELMGI